MSAISYATIGVFSLMLFLLLAACPPPVPTGFELGLATLIAVAGGTAIALVRYVRFRIRRRAVLEVLFQQCPPIYGRRV